MSRSTSILLLYIACLWLNVVSTANFMDAAISTTNYSLYSATTKLPSRERLKRLIPYMTYYLTANGGGGGGVNQQHRIPNGRILTIRPQSNGVNKFNYVQQLPPPMPAIVVQPPQRHQLQQQPPVSVNYLRYRIQQQQQQPSPLTKMITQNYVSIAKQIANTNRLQTTRLNTYSPQYKHETVVDHQRPSEVLYKTQPSLIKQIEEPVDYIYQHQQQQHDDDIDDVDNDKTSLTPSQLHYQKPQIPIEIGENLKSKQYFIIRRPGPPPPSPPQALTYKLTPTTTTTTTKTTTGTTEYKPYNEEDSVTITQSQEVDVSGLATPKYHAKYVDTEKIRPIITNSYHQHHQRQQYHYPEYEEENLYQYEDQDQEHDEIDNNQDFNRVFQGLSLSKSLPDKITPENLDSSIRTLSKLLRILQRANALPQSAKTLVSNFPRPKSQTFTVKANPFKITKLGVHQKFPIKTLDQEEGSTPGRAGIDYPIHHEIPQTHFNCKEQRYKGFFGDPETGCQVWHYCDLNGGQASFLCPNGTIFSQVALTCDWWFNVKCASTAQLYVLNERLYKYILPQKLSFPEDFQGPLVDQYLSLKFKENEEKDRKKTIKNNEEMDDEEEDEELELPYSEDVATTLNKVRSISNKEDVTSN